LDLGRGRETGGGGRGGKREEGWKGKERGEEG